MPRIKDKIARAILPLEVPITVGPYPPTPCNRAFKGHCGTPCRTAAWCGVVRRALRVTLSRFVSRWGTWHDLAAVG